IANGMIKTAPSGKIRERLEKKADGEHTQLISTTGRVEKEVVQKADGSQRTTHYDLGGKTKREEVVSKDGAKAVTTHEFGRDGSPRVQQTVQFDKGGREVSKTVIVKNTTIINNKVT